MSNNQAVILIVDDIQANILSMRSLLESPDRTFLQATTGKQALTIILNNQIDLIILDVQMPEMDGFEVAQIIKSNRRTQDIPIIFATAEKKEYQSLVRGFEAGAIDYLFKPLDPEIARAKVSVLLKIHLQKKELEIKNISLEKTALLINNSADIIGVIDPVTLRFEEVNNAFTTILGYSIEEAKEKPVTFYLSESARSNVCELAHKVQGGVIFETQVHCHDKSIKWLQWNVVVKSGKWYSNARDITESKQVETFKTHLAAIVKQSNDAIYILDNNLEIISWNKGAQQVFGYTGKEAAGMSVWKLIPENLHTEFFELISDINKNEQKSGLETRRINKDGNAIDVSFSGSKITDIIKDQNLIAITERDITQQKISNEKIKQLNVNLENKVKERTRQLTEKETVLRDLLVRLTKSEKEVRNFATYLNKAIEDERSHLAREIHDELGQQLAGIKIGLSTKLMTDYIDSAMSTNLKNVIPQIDIMMQTLRKIATQLRPGILDSLGLVASIEWLVKEFHNKTGIKYDIELNGMEMKFEKEISICFFRICQEALTNIAKHSQATKIIVETYVNNGQLLLIITDNGKGISNDHLQNPFSMGILGMKERANIIGADLNINSKIGNGTTIQLKIKYKR